jgi:ElaB/YqjD/DUF883 family membrane-anchored ribosome-binding protein
MNDNPQPQTETDNRGAEAWQEVGRQFQSLGESLATAFKSAWESEENRQRAEAMRSGLESLIDNVGQVIRETAQSDKGQQVVNNAKGAAESLRQAGEQTVQEVRPRLVDALQKVNDELTRLIDSLGTDKGGQP